MTTTAASTPALDHEPLVGVRAAFDAVIASFATGRHRVNVECDAALRLPGDIVAPLCAVVREAVDNALRHAFPNAIDGRIWVRLFEDRGGRLTLTVRDNGIGMPDFADYDSGGRSRIVAAARALNAYARMGAAPFGGALVSIICPP